MEIVLFICLYANARISRGCHPIKCEIKQTSKFFLLAGHFCERVILSFKPLCYNQKKQTIKCGSSFKLPISEPTLFLSDCTLWAVVELGSIHLGMGHLTEIWTEPQKSCRKVRTRAANKYKSCSNKGMLQSTWNCGEFTHWQRCHENSENA